MMKEFETHSLGSGLRELQQAVTRWQLVADGLPFQTSTSVLQYVLVQGEPAVLKVALCEEERRGAELLRWWDGVGAVRVLAHHENATLLERACGQQSLAEMARSGRDDEASRIMCAVIARLHARPYVQSDPACPALVPRSEWFAALLSAGERGGLFRETARVAKDLLAAPQDVVALHGDVHHGNSNAFLVAFALKDHMAAEHALQLDDALAVNAAVTRAPGDLHLYKATFAQDAHGKTLKGIRLHLQQLLMQCFFPASFHLFGNGRQNVLLRRLLWLFFLGSGGAVGANTLHNGLNINGLPRLVLRRQRPDAALGIINKPVLFEICPRPVQAVLHLSLARFVGVVRLRGNSIWQIECLNNFVGYFFNAAGTAEAFQRLEGGGA